MSTWREVLADTTAALDHPHEARFICEHAAGLDAGEFATSLDHLVTQRMGLHVHDMVRRRIAGEPLQYVMGRWAFRHLDVLVDPRVLIPRPETELVAEVALHLAREVSGHRTVVDLGTGSGVIGLSLAFELPLEDTTVWLTDVSSDALDVARANLAGIGRAGANVHISEGSWYEALPTALHESVDVIVSNPPYIAINDPDLAQEVVSFEPPLALFADEDGLASLRTVVSQAPRWLRRGGALVLEIGHRQGDAVRGLIIEAGLRSVEIRRDLAGRDRVAVARR